MNRRSLRSVAPLLLALGTSLPNWASAQYSAGESSPAPLAASIEFAPAADVSEGSPWALRTAMFESALLQTEALPASPAGPGSPSPIVPVSFAEAPPDAAAVEEAPPAPPAGEDALKKEFESLKKQIEKLESAAEKKKADEEKKPTAKITAQFQHDSYFLVDQTAANMAAVGDANPGEAFRRARIGVFGNYSITEYRIEMDFALAGRPSFLDVWAALNDLPYVDQVKVGHFFEPFCFERITPNRFVTFMERALPDAFAPARNSGVSATKLLEEERIMWTVGVFRTNSDVWGDDVGGYDETSVTGRVTWLPYYDEPSGGRYYWHLGAAGSYRGADASTVRFRSRPEATVGSTLAIPYFIDTGNLAATSYQLGGLESAWVHGPLSVSGEYIFSPVQQKEAPDPVFTGWYVQTSYFLTGESRPYDPVRGIFNRLEPFENFFRVRTDRGVQMGTGAWEVAARVSNMDLNSQTVQGGALTDVTLGLNWYMTPYLRVTTNYVHAFLDSPVDGDSGADVFAARIGYEF